MAKFSLSAFGVKAHAVPVGISMALLASPAALFAQGAPERVADNALSTAASAAALAYRLDAAGQAHAPQTPGDSDLGDQVVLLPNHVYEPFSVITNFEGQYTSNAALTEDHELDDFLYRAEVAGAYVPHLMGNLYGQLNASYEFYRYDEHSRLDFDNLEAGAGLVHVFRKLSDLSVWGRYEYTRITNGPSSYDELYANHGLEAGLFVPISLTARQNLYLSQISNFSLSADPGFAQFNEFNFIIGHELLATDELSLRTYYQFAVHDYSDYGRTDLTSSVGFAARYEFCRNAFLTLAGSYATNDSDTNGGDYEVGTLGAILGLSVTF